MSKPLEERKTQPPCATALRAQDLSVSMEDHLIHLSQPHWDWKQWNQFFCSEETGSRISTCVLEWEEVVQPLKFWLLDKLLPRASSVTTRNSLMSRPRENWRNSFFSTTRVFLLLIQEGASQRSSEERVLERVSRNPTDEHYLHRTGKSVESCGGY